RKGGVRKGAAFLVLDLPPLAGEVSRRLAQRERRWGMCPERRFPLRPWIRLRLIDGTPLPQVGEGRDGRLVCYQQARERRPRVARDKLVLVGQVAGGFGVRGEVRVTAYTA